MIVVIIRFSIVLGNPALCCCCNGPAEIASAAVGLFSHQISFVAAFVVVVVVVLAR